MNLFLSLSLLGLATASSSSNSLTDVVTPQKGASCACKRLSRTFDGVIFPKNASYTEQAADKYWDIRADLSPACVFLPASADEVSKAMSLFNSCNAQFAVRGGGHMNASLIIRSGTNAIQLLTFV
jgi:hypothetical protein